MNKITNDAKQEVTSVGSEGSEAWCREAYPIAIEEGKRLHSAGNYSQLGRSSAFLDFMQYLREEGVDREHWRGIFLNTPWSDDYK